MQKTTLTAAIIAEIKLALKLGYYQHIATGYYGLNQGRASEIKHGKIGANIPAADYLPPDFPALA